MEKLRNIHPGEILNEEFLLPLGISAYRLAKETFIPQTRVREILKGNRRIIADNCTSSLQILWKQRQILAWSAK
jgi:antitoxin HigA-1